MLFRPNVVNAPATGAVKHNTAHKVTAADLAKNLVTLYDRLQGIANTAETLHIDPLEIASHAYALMESEPKHYYPANMREFICAISSLDDMANEKQD